MTGRVRRLAIVGVGLVVAAVVLLPASPASAHPLGNFTTNVYAGVVVRPDAVVVDYVVDLAEIPALQSEPDRSRVGAGWGSQQCAALADGVDVRVGGQRVALEGRARSLTMPPGQAGLSTLRLECRLRGPAVIDGRSPLSVDDGNFEGRIGWRELTLAGDRVTVTSDLPAVSVSSRLTAYPEDQLRSPLDVRVGSATVAPGGAALAGDGESGSPAGDVLPGAVTSLTSLVESEHLTLWFGLLAMLLAAGLGALHALAPGHGKTVMAAYLVGQHGSPKQVIPLGLAVAATHTSGVVLLGALLWTSQLIAPERLFPYLSLASGAIVVALGLTLLVRGLRRWRRGQPLAHHHHHHDGDGGHDHGHGHHHHGHDHDVRVGLPTRDLVALGFAGGLVPTPSALLVLLGSIALGRAWFGLVLVIGYGIGMAATLVGAGLVLVGARAAIERRLGSRGGARLARLSLVLPMVTASVVLGAGLLLVARSAMAV